MGEYVPLHLRGSQDSSGRSIVPSLPADMPLNSGGLRRTWLQPGRGRGRGRGRSSVIKSTSNRIEIRPQSSNPSSSLQLFSEKRFGWLLDAPPSEDGEPKIAGAVDAENFIRYILERDDKLDTLSRLTSSRYGLEMLTDAFSLDQSAGFVQKAVIPFIRFVSKDERMTLGSARGAIVLKLLRTVFEVPSLFDRLLSYVLEGQLTNEECCDAGWFVLQIIRGGNEFAIETKHDPRIVKLAEALTTSDNFLAKIIGGNINNLLDNVYVLSLDEDHEGMASILPLQQNSPGWRHTNDKTDFRSISIYPTADELKSKEPEFLPLTCKVFKQSKYVPHYLDWAFRLLRADVVQSVRQEVDLLLNRDGVKHGSDQKLITRLENRSVNVVKFVDISCQSWNGVGFKMEFQIPKQLERRLDREALLPALEEQITKEYWRKQRRFLQSGCVLAFIRNRKELAYLGLVSARNEDDLCDASPFVVVSFFDKAAIDEVILQIGQAQGDLEAVQLSAFFYSCNPVLERLKLLCSIPFEFELLKWSPNDSAAAVVPPLYFDDSLSEVVKLLKAAPDDANLKRILNLNRDLTLDSNQKEAIISSLNHRVALIQGPPGTGKSFCGAILAKILFDCTTETMLCVCYTNHALDQFLEDLIGFGLPCCEIVRIGGSEKISETMKAYTVRSQLDSLKAAPNFDRTLTSMGSKLKHIQHQISDLLEEVDYARNTKSLHVFTHFFSNELTDAFSMPEDESGFQIVGENNVPLKYDYLWNRWIAGEDRGTIKLFDQWAKTVSRDNEYPWSLPRDERDRRISDIRKEMLNPLFEKIEKLMTEFDERQKEVAELKETSVLKLLRSKRIIGCTTSGAAIHSKALDAVNAGILIIEECAEILEPHVIASMSSDCKHLIMIGDHKQLRPKLNVFNLSVESGSPYEFNKSLFERLIGNGFPHVTLQLQHRMRPEVSEFVRQITYPELRDANSVQSRPNLRATLSNVMFVHHEIPEGFNNLITDQDIVTDNLSKVNYHEVQMVAKISEYLLQQGYHCGQICILTPYLAQLQALRNAMSNVFVTESDLADLANFFGEEEDSNINNNDELRQSHLHRTRIRVSTVDNFQGEEADIVIVSLVRSNPDGVAGFVGEPERVNVLLSRAKLGMILIGNMRTFENSKASVLWQKLLGIFKSKNAIYPGFPIHCQVHDRTQIVSSPDDFNKLSPNGGCDADCGELLNCDKHHCPRKCHRLPISHDNVKCEAKDERICLAGHAVSVSCNYFGRFVDEFCEDCTKAEEIQDKSVSHDDFSEPYPQTVKQVSEMWQEEKENRDARSKAMDKLFDLPELLEVKYSILKLYRMITAAGKEKNKFFNVCFRALSDCGKKTMIAHIYAEILVDLKVLSGSCLREVNAARLIRGGIERLKKHVNDLDKEGGGILVINDALQLFANKVGSKQTDTVLENLLEQMDGFSGKIVVAFSDPGDIAMFLDMEAKWHQRFPYRFDIIENA